MMVSRLIIEERNSMNEYMKMTEENLLHTYNRFPITLDRGDGVYLYDTDGKKYLDYAEKILKSLSSDAYLAKVGENQGFILMHSVGSLPNGSEIDTPLNYADYYYLEALKRFMDLKKLRLENGEVKVIE
jgi:hypothetical protein